MKQQLLGGITPQEFFAAFFFALIGVTLSLLFQANNRDIKTTATPFQFKYSFLLLDNWKRILLSLLLIFVAIRFTTEIFGLKLTMWQALLIGLALDKISQFLKNRVAAFQTDREKIQ